MVPKTQRFLFHTATSKHEPLLETCRSISKQGLIAEKPEVHAPAPAPDDVLTL